MPIPDLSLENSLGPYRLLRKLGEGGMGTVYLGHDSLLDRRVAIKVLHPAEPSPAGQTAKAREKFAATLAKRFLREARSAARISHPNVVTIYSVGEHAARPYLVMEYVEGGSLADHLRKSGPMHWRDAAAAMRDALRGLAAAHAKGIIHRDIKPANLMRARGTAGEEIIKLVDFGLARILAGPNPADGELTFPGAFVGSPSYSSPEQVAGVQTIDGRADLYSLAAAGYALLTGQPPFVEDDPADIMHHHLRDPFPAVGLLAPTVPEPLQKILTRASRKKPDQRYDGALEMLAAVEAVLELPRDLAPNLPPTPRPLAPPQAASSAESTVIELEARLATARAKSDSTTQLDTLRTLYSLYSQLDRREQATHAFREALVLHVKIHTPALHDN